MLFVSLLFALSLYVDILVVLVYEYIYIYIYIQFYVGIYIYIYAKMNLYFFLLFPIAYCLFEAARSLGPAEVVALVFSFRNGFSWMAAKDVELIALFEWPPSPLEATVVVAAGSLGGAPTNPHPPLTASQAQPPILKLPGLCMFGRSGTRRQVSDVDIYICIHIYVYIYIYMNFRRF